MTFSLSAQGLAGVCARRPRLPLSPTPPTTNVAVFKKEPRLAMPGLSGRTA